jgi:hypothetical protein
MGLDASDIYGSFPFLSFLEANFQTFLEEALAAPVDAYVTMPSDETYEGTWRALPLAIGPWGHEFPGVDYAKNRALCPRTFALLQQVEGLTVGGFLRVEAGTTILPHQDFRDDHEIRAHLGLRLPEHEAAYWPEGTARVIDIRVRHGASNPGPGPRITLMVDVRMPFVVPTGAVPAWGAPG